ncbi:MAG: DUF4179 domain-containing protein [Clostridiaceae bacterium]
MMEDKLISKLIKKEINNLDENQLPPSVELKLNKAYETIRKDEVNISEGNENIKNMKKHNKKRYVMAATIIICLLTIASFNPVLAEKIPVLKEMSHYLKDIYWFSDNIITNASEINITQKDQGIEINLQGVVYDESSIKLIYTLTSDKKLQWGVQMNDSSLKVNGKDILNVSGKNIEAEKVIIDDKKISKEDDEIEKYAVVTTFDISDMKLDDNVELSWEPRQIHTFDGVYAKGDWKFGFKISKEALKNSSKIIDTNYVIEKEGYQNIIERIIFTPVETKIVVKHDGKINEDAYKAYLELEKDPENKEKQEKLAKLNKIDDEMYAFLYKITDENGNEFKILRGRGRGDENGGRTTLIYKPVEKIPEKLTFDSLKNDYNKITEIPLKELKAPFEIKQGENMSITVNSIENNNGKIRINATFNGDYIATRIKNGSICIYPKDLKTQEEIYKAADKIEKDNLLDYYSKADKENNIFDFNFEVDPSQEYIIRFTGDYSKLNEFSIDLNK